MNKDTPETKVTETSEVTEKPTETTAPKATASETKTTKKPTYRKTKSWVIIAAILLVIIGIGAYLAWTMQPANAIANSFSNLVKNRNDSFSFEIKSNYDGEIRTTAKGQIGYKNDQVHVKAEAPEGEILDGTLEVKHLGEDGTFLKATGIEQTAVNFQQALFTEVFSGGQEISEDAMASMREATIAAIKPFVDLTEDKWIVIDQQNIKDSFDSGTGDTYKCIQESMSLLDKGSNRNEIQSLYREHQFIVVEEELGTKDGAVGFIVSLDDDKLDDFTDGVKDTEFYKKIQECTESEDQAEAALDSFNIAPSSSETDNVKAELWIERFGHKLRTAEFTTSNDKGEVEASFKLDFTTDFEADFNRPEGAMSLKDVIKSLTEDTSAALAPEGEVAPEAVQ